MATVAPDVISRDWPVMMAMTVALFIMARGNGRIGRLEGTGLLLAYAGYNAWLLVTVL
jgi:cation:H+ antiporter